MLQRGRRALRRKKAPLRHPRGADAELRRAAAAAGDRLDHEVDVDTGFKPERHGFRGSCDVNGDEQIVDEFDPACGTERSEIEAGIGKSAHVALGLGAGLLVTGEIDHRLARRHHSRRSADLAVEKSRAFGGKRSHVTFLVRHRI